MRGLRGVARCEHLIAHLHDLNNLPDDHVHYAEEDTLNSQLLDPSRALRGFFKAADCVIATSATLAVDGNAFHIVEETGFEPDVGHAVGSPFDYTKQALLVVPDTMPEPNAPTFLEQLKLHVERIVNQARGRTLVLCTSYRAVHYLKEHLDVPYPVLYQGDLPRMRLLERFGQDISSVLVGTESFWGGVDIPGESLSCVVIDRLPFQSPADPVVAELSRRNEDFFWQVSVPRAVLSFRQGFGRLIRRTTDKGVVVVLDRRIATKSYGFSFTGSLPPMGRTSSIEEIGRFLDGDPT